MTESLSILELSILVLANLLLKVRVYLVSMNDVSVAALCLKSLVKVLKKKVMTAIIT